MQKIVLMPVIAIILIISGSCASNEVQRVNALPLPVRPLLPAITSQELAAVPDATAGKIIQRDRLRREYAEKLEAIICATREGVC